MRQELRLFHHWAKSPSCPMTIQGLSFHFVPFILGQKTFIQPETESNPNGGRLHPRNRHPFFRRLRNCVHYTASGLDLTPVHFENSPCNCSAKSVVMDSSTPIHNSSPFLWGTMFGLRKQTGLSKTEWHVNLCPGSMPDPIPDTSLKVWINNCQQTINKQPLTKVKQWHNKQLWELDRDSLHFVERHIFFFCLPPHMNWLAQQTSWLLYRWVLLYSNTVKVNLNSHWIRTLANSSPISAMPIKSASLICFFFFLKLERKTIGIGFSN